MKKEHHSWIIPGRVEICTFDGIPALDCIGPNALQDVGIVQQFEREYADKLLDCTPKEFEIMLEELKGRLS